MALKKGGTKSGPASKKRKQADNPALDSLNGQLMMLAAFRYCVGRSSYIVGSAMQWFADWWALATDNTRYVILRDLLESLSEADGVDKFNRPGWRSFAEAHFRMMPAAARNRLRRDTYLRGRPWPIDPGLEEEEPDA